MKIAILDLVSQVILLVIVIIPVELRAQTNSIPQTAARTCLLR